MLWKSKQKGQLNVNKKQIENSGKKECGCQDKDLSFKFNQKNTSLSTC